MNSLSLSYLFLIFNFWYKIEFLLWLNLNIYVCEVFSWKLEPRLPTLYKHLYLWSDHCTKDAWWSLSLIKKEKMFVKLSFLPSIECGLSFFNSKPSFSRNFFFPTLAKVLNPLCVCVWGWRYQSNVSPSKNTKSDWISLGYFVQGF